MALGVTTILLALGVGIGVTLTTNPASQAAIVVISGLILAGLTSVLRRTGEIWHFTAPYPDHRGQDESLETSPDAHRV